MYPVPVSAGCARSSKRLRLGSLPLLMMVGLLVTDPVRPAEPASDSAVTNIVVIEGLDSGRPFWRLFDEHFRRRMAEISDGPVALYGESTDLTRFPRSIT